MRITRLSDRYHLVAPDYPGFGHTDWPDPKKFAYTFDHYAEVMNHFTEALGLARYSLMNGEQLTYIVKRAVCAETYLPSRGKLGKLI